METFLLDGFQKFILVIHNMFIFHWKVTYEFLLACLALIQFVFLWLGVAGFESTVNAIVTGYEFIPEKRLMGLVGCEGFPRGVWRLRVIMST